MYEVWEWDTYIADGAEIDKLVYLVFNEPLVAQNHIQPLNGGMGNGLLK